MKEMDQCARVSAGELEKYKKSLRTGQKKRIWVNLIPGGEKKVQVEAVIMAIYQDLVKVQYRILVEGAVVPKKAIREECARIADLMIWDEGGQDERCRSRKGKTGRDSETDGNRRRG